MNPTNTPDDAERLTSDPEFAPTVGDGIEIRLLSTAQDMIGVGEVFQQVWGSSTELVRLEMLMAISHAGGYVVAAYDTSRGDVDGVGGARESILGASVAVLARHNEAPALHSHVTGILPGARSTGLGRALKMHQRAWAAERGIDWIVWTFDPLVRHNAWFNIAVLGAEVHEYLPHFYGTMTDALNAGDDSDRLLVAWDVHAEIPDPPRDGGDIAGAELIGTPADVVALRRTDLGEVRRWRTDTRTALSNALNDGRSVVGFTRDGSYVVAS